MIGLGVRAILPKARIKGLLAVVALLSAGCREQPTYHDDVAPILARHCVTCHSQNGVARVPTLETYPQVRAAAAKIRRAVERRDMPPWGADDTGLCGKWKGALWLTDHELQTIVKWTAGDRPPGKPAKVRELPPPARFEKNGPTLDMGADYRPGIGALAYRCFVVDPKLDRDRLVSAFRVTSTEPRSVAQITLYTLDAGAEAKAIELDRGDDAPGYTCYGSSRVPEARLVTSWTWDGPVLRLPDNIGIRLRGREKLVMQMHYDVIATGPNVPTRTRIELELDDAAREGSFWDISPDSLSLAPGRALVEASTEVAVNRTRTVLGIAPRMHTLGKTMQLDRVRGGKTECVGNFDHWHFYRQRFFEYASPLVLEAGDKLKVSCVYDTRNRAEPVVMGERIEDEQCLASLLVQSER